MPRLAACENAHELRNGGRIITGHNYQVDVVRHQAVAQDLNRKILFRREKIVQVESVILTLGEHRLAVVSTLHDMEWGMGNEKASVAWHKDPSGTDSALAG